MATAALRMNGRGWGGWGGGKNKELCRGGDTHNLVSQASYKYLVASSDSRQGVCEKISSHSVKFAAGRLRHEQR